MHGKYCFTNGKQKPDRIQHLFLSHAICTLAILIYNRIFISYILRCISIAYFCMPSLKACFAINGYCRYFTSSKAFFLSSLVASQNAFPYYIFSSGKIDLDSSLPSLCHLFPLPHQSSVVLFVQMQPSVGQHCKTDQ